MISVLVPVYKVEKYIRRCLDSVIGQTYANLEIILVDDGSPDASGKICDEYSQRDARIRVRHIPNGGLSVARNTGLDMATGEYIGFVDSDDWVEPTMFEDLLKHAVSEKSDIAMCGMNRIKDGHKSEAFYFNRTCNVATDDFLESLFKDEIGSQVWSCLYRKEMFEDVRFPEGRTCLQDVAVMHRVFARANKIAFLHKALYNYNINDASVSYSPRPTLQILRFKAFADRYEYALEKYPQYASHALVLASSHARMAINRYLLFKPAEEKEMIGEPIVFLEKHREAILSNVHIGPNDLKGLRLYYFNRRLYSLVFKCKYVLKNRCNPRRLNPAKRQ